MPSIRTYTSIKSISPKKQYTYRLAAASSAKRTPLRHPQYNRDFFLHSSTSIPAQQPYLRSTKDASGEDAFFATSVGNSSHVVAFGVADGVGGWQDQGVDPSDFSHALCGLMAGTAHLWDESAEKRKVRPLGLLQTAYDAVMSNPRILAGGSTASLAVIDADGEVECANLGDSSFILLSPGKISYRSDIQTHAFNTPYQLSKIPAQLQQRQAIFGAQHFSEKPSQADVTRHKVRHGDLVVFATDGVWDNLSSGDVLNIVTRIMHEGGFWYEDQNETFADAGLIREIPQEIKEGDEETFLPGLLASALMREAKMAGLDRRRNSPFAKEVNARYPDEQWEGGKPDDIAVVVCVAVEEGGDGGVEGDEEGGEERPIKAKL